MKHSTLGLVCLLSSASVLSACSSGKRWVNAPLKQSNKHNDVRIMEGPQEPQSAEPQRRSMREFARRVEMAARCSCAGL